jgi:hypothetical protein
MDLETSQKELVIGDFYGCPVDIFFCANFRDKNSLQNEVPHRLLPDL